MKSKLLTVALGLLFLCGYLSAADSKKEARVTQIIRDVKILPAGAAARAAVLNDQIKEDSGVRTGGDSRSELTFVDLTITRLGANTIFSFNKAGRNDQIDSGSILLRVPKDSGGGRVRSSAVTVAVTGTTFILESTKGGRNRLYVLEGGARIALVKYPKQFQNVRGAQMVDVPPGATTIPAPVNFDLNDLMKSHPLIRDFPPLPSQGLIASTAAQPPPPAPVTGGPPIVTGPPVLPIPPVIGPTGGGQTTTGRPPGSVQPGGGSSGSGANPKPSPTPRIPRKPTGTTAGGGTTKSSNPSSTPAPVILRKAPGQTKTPTSTTTTSKSNPKSATTPAPKRTIKKTPPPHNGPR